MTTLAEAIEQDPLPFLVESIASDTRQIKTLEERRLARVQAWATLRSPIKLGDVIDAESFQKAVSENYVYVPFGKKHKIRVVQIIGFMEYQDYPAISYQGVLIRADGTDGRDVAWTWRPNERREA